MDRLTTPSPPNRLREHASQNRPKSARRSEHQTHQTVVLRPVLHLEHPSNQDRDQNLYSSTSKALNGPATDKHGRRSG
jgi:hypothetical protein